MSRLIVILFVLLISSYCQGQQQTTNKKGTIVIKKKTTSESEEMLDETFPELELADTLQAFSFGNIQDWAKTAGVYSSKYQDITYFECSIPDNGVYLTLASKGSAITQAMWKRLNKLSGTGATITFTRIKAVTRRGKIVNLPSFTAKASN